MAVASVRKHRDKWQAQVRLKGIKPIAKSFDRKSDALTWAKLTESEVIRGVYVDQRSAESVLIENLIDRYLSEQKASKNHKRSTRSRCGRLRSHLGRFSLSRVSQPHLAQYRDQRLEVASSMTVIHELNLLHRIMRLAVTEWGYRLPGEIPSVTLPKRPPGRVRRLCKGEEQRLFEALESDPEMRAIVKIALETGIRRGEIAKISAEDVDVDASTLRVPETKIGVPRTIPLTPVALEIVRERTRKRGRAFSIDAPQITSRFRKACSRSHVFDLRFHDLRHEAVSRLLERGLNTVEVAAISGHMTLAMLSRYSHIGTEHLVQKLRVPNS